MSYARDMRVYAYRKLISFIVMATVIAKILLSHDIEVNADYIIE